MSRLLCATACRRTRMLSYPSLGTLLKTARHSPPPHLQHRSWHPPSSLCLRHWVLLGKVITRSTSRLFCCRGHILQLTDVPASSQHLELWRPFKCVFLQAWSSFTHFCKHYFFIPLAKSSVSVEETFCLCRRIFSISWRNRFDSIILESQHLIRHSFCQNLIRQSFWTDVAICKVLF